MQFRAKNCERQTIKWVQKTRFSRKQVDLIMLSKLALVSLIGVSGTYSSIVPVEQKPLMLQCEPVDMAGRNALVNSRSGKDVSGKSFLDRYYGSFFDNIQIESNSMAPDGSLKKQPGTLDWSLHSLMVNDEYEYPDKDDLRDINGTNTLYRGGEFGGLVTFAHTPYANCYDPAFYDKEEFDIAVVGAPFDSGVSYRPGARFGPSGIRMGSRRLAPAYSVYRDSFDPYSNWAKIVDCGDPPVTPLDNRVALDQIYRANRAIGRHKTTQSNPNKSPKVFTLGGDHTITLIIINEMIRSATWAAVIDVNSATVSNGGDTSTTSPPTTLSPSKPSRIVSNSLEVHPPGSTVPEAGVLAGSMESTSTVI